jgi:mRNA turnover protein 4
MAKSKRNRVVSLTKTKKTKLLDKKSKFVEKVHKLIDTYTYTYTFAYKNMTTLAMQSLRQFFREDGDESVFLLGKSTVIQVALGRTEEESYKPNIFALSETIHGTCGLFFSNKSPESIIR